MRFARHLPPPPPDVGAAVVRARSVSVELGGRRVVAQVDLDVVAGELLALVGPNGAGKSTLLAAVAGDLPTTGELLLDGRPVADWSPAELALRRALLPQQVDVAFPFTVREVVEMGRAPWCRTPAAEDDDDVVSRAMELADVSAFAPRQVTSLSGGERARVGLARVLAQSTPVLLLDEPTAALDLAHQELVLAVCRRRAAEGAAVVIVLHDLGLAGAYADRIALLDRGRLARVGTPTEVLDAELVGEVYGCRVEVLPHPRTGSPLVIPVRQPAERV